MTPRTALVCRSSDRRAIVKCQNETSQHPTWNGIDYVEFNGRQGTRWILVYLLCPIPKKPEPAAAGVNHLQPSNFLLWDELTKRNVKIVSVKRLSDTCFQLVTEAALCPGHCYRLTLVKLDRIDPQFAGYSFTATAETTDVDPAPRQDCPGPSRSEPQPNYLARDYASFRQLLLDRLALIMPAWKERHVPDLGLTLIEALAYVGDYLSYYQDAVATEAYLHTARQRISVRRHARLVDYQLHEGCNARTFIHVEVEGDLDIDPRDAFFITAHPDSKYAGRSVLSATTLEHLPENSYQPFEMVCVHTARSDFTPGAVTNVLEVIRGLVSCASGDATSFPARVARFLWDHLSEDVRQRLQACLHDNQHSVCPKLSATLIDELAVILREFRLRDEVCCGCDSDEAPLREQVACPDSNLSIIAAALEGHVSGAPNERQKFYASHNKIPLYTWSGRQCCLAKGATRATLKDGDPACLPNCREAPATLTDAAPASLPNCGQEPSNEPQPPQTWTLRNLQCGDLLAFEEVLGPNTHLAGDAHPAHRWVVRLTKVECKIDPLTCQKIVEVEWNQKDALPFSLCISSVGPRELGCQLNEEISVARGNVVLVDHGLRNDEPYWLGEVHYQPASGTCDQDDALPPRPHEPARAELLRPVLPSDLTYAATIRCSDSATELLAQKEHESLPAVRVFGFPMASEPADSAREADVPPPTLIDLEEVNDPLNLLLRYGTFELDEQRRVEQMLPPADARFLQETRAGARRGELQAVQLAQSNACPDAANVSSQLQSLPAKTRDGLKSFAAALRAAVLWQPKPHLMASQPDAQDFVVEVDNERRAHLRFGDDDLGRRPFDSMSFYANYRRGNGTAGNVGAEKIVHLMYRRQQVGGIRAVRNLLPAKGGTDPETLDHARLLAPRQYLKQRRAITREDYATIALNEFADQVQQARASLKWMGTWYEVALVIDPYSSVQDPEQLRRKVQAALEKYRRIGHLLRVSLPIYVGLDIAMTVCVKPGHLRAHVRQALAELFGNGLRSDGTKAFFSPDNFTFGDSLYLSAIVSAAKQVAGVENVLITRFQRYGHNDVLPLQAGVLDFGPLEIPRLDNDPLHPKFGRFCLDMRGAR